MNRGTCFGGWRTPIRIETTVLHSHKNIDNNSQNHEINKIVLFSVDDFQHWITQEVPLAVGLKRFIIRVIRGGRTFEDDQGDIAFDNFEVERRDCHLGTYKQVQ